MLTVIADLDKKIFFFFQTIQSFELDFILSWPTRFGEIPVAMTFVGLFILLIDKNKGYEKIGISCLAILTSHWVSEYLKEVFMRPRPYLFYEHVRLIFGSPSSFSFPSGHATTVFCAVALLNVFYPGRMSWLWILAIWVGLTRIYIGVHYPTDVLAGAALGTACAILVLKIFKIISARV